MSRRSESGEASILQALDGVRGKTEAASGRYQMLLNIPRMSEARHDHVHLRSNRLYLMLAIVKGMLRHIGESCVLGSVEDQALPHSMELSFRWK